MTDPANSTNPTAAPPTATPPTPTPTPAATSAAELRRQLAEAEERERRAAATTPPPNPIADATRDHATTTISDRATIVVAATIVSLAIIFAPRGGVITGGETGVKATATTITKEQGVILFSGDVAETAVTVNMPAGMEPTVTAPPEQASRLTVRELLELKATGSPVNVLVTGTPKK